MVSPGYNTNQIGPKLGMMAQGYADRWPDLSNRLLSLYHTQVADIPWLPSYWLGTVDALHGRESQILVPITSMGANIPWLDTPDKKAWWNDFAGRVAKVVGQYAASQQAAAQAQLTALENDAVFYDRAYRLASALAAPITGLQTLWANPGMVGVILWGGVGLVAIVALRGMFTKSKRN